MIMAENGKAVIHIINNFKVKKPNQAFRCIMIYQDLDTGFCFVKPLLYKIDLEIVMELFKIFTSYGPPAELHVNSCTQEMVDNMDVHMKALCPMFNINFIKKNADNNDIAMKVVTKLHTWMETTNKEEWEIGCYIVQREINLEHSGGSSHTPQRQFFKGLGKLNNTTENTNKQNVCNITQEQNMCNVTQEQNIHTVTREKIRTNVKNMTSGLQKELNTLSNDLSDSVRVKEEIIDSEETSSISERMVVFEGGLILPNLKKEMVEIKVERIDE